MNSLFDELDKSRLRPLHDPNDRPLVSRKDIEDVEKEFGFRFPLLYLEFLLRYGLSSFDSGDAWINVPADWNKLTDYSPSDVRVFYGLNTEQEDETWNLRAEIRSSRTNSLPPHFLPVCESDGCSTVVYLSCREQDYGHVYCLKRNQIWDVMGGQLSTREASEMAFHLADSFEEFLKNIRVDSDEDDDEEMFPLYVAMLAEDKAFLQRIIDDGQAENYRNEIGWSLLRCAIASGLSWPVDLVLQHVEPTSEDLSFAVQFGHLDAIRGILAHGVNINSRIPINNISPEWQTVLIQCVGSSDYYRKYEVAQVLVEAGAEVNMKDSTGKTALDYVHPLNSKMRRILFDSVISRE